MQKFLFLYFILAFKTFLLADSPTVYDIRGTSPLLDANLTLFLDRWRQDTITPVQNGTYTNVIVNGSTDTKSVALTFDDSPDENNTAQILDILKCYGVKASFFMIGSPMVDANATVVRRAADEGHLVLNHSFTHSRLTALSSEQIVQELRDTSQRIADITGTYPRFFRPPYGSIDHNVVNTVNAAGFTTVLWSLDSLDWAIQEKNGIVDNVVSNVRNGDIILMHSGRSNYATIEALGEIIEKLRNMGYRFMNLDDMFAGTYDFTPEKSI